MERWKVSDGDEGERQSCMQRPEKCLPLLLKLYNKTLQHTADKLNNVKTTFLNVES